MKKGTHWYRIPQYTESEQKENKTKTFRRLGIQAVSGKMIEHGKDLGLGAQY